MIFYDHIFYGLEKMYCRKENGERTLISLSLITSQNWLFYNIYELWDDELHRIDLQNKRRICPFIFQNQQI